MRVSGYLVPFPDLGAADMMSDHLEQEVQATGPGRIFMRVSLPRTRDEGLEGPSESGGRYSRKKLELFRLEGKDWILLWDATSDSYQESEEVSWEVLSAGTLKSRLTNMSGMEGQFSLECTFIQSDDDEY
jgi:hypothetical protein